jgi:hypothetical protein
LHNLRHLLGIRESELVAAAEFFVISALRVVPLGCR